MSNEFDTGGLESAFPSTFKSLDPDPHQIHRWGMTLRDYFAAKAMQAVLTSPILMAAVGSKGGSATQHIAKQSYEMADAMIIARNQ